MKVGRVRVGRGRCATKLILSAAVRAVKVNKMTTHEKKEENMVVCLQAISKPSLVEGTRANKQTVLYDQVLYSFSDWTPTFCDYCTSYE